MSYTEMAGVARRRPRRPRSMMSHRRQTFRRRSPRALLPTPDADVRVVLENGIREIAGEVRNSLDFHRSQEGGGEVARVVLSGAALDLPGFAEALQEQLGIEVQRESVRLDGQSLGGVSAHRLAIAAGLAVEEAPR